MKIATVTVNPALDQTVSVDNFTAGAVNRSRAIRFDAGGKGVNVASFLADYGLDVAVTGFLGEENASIFEHHFSRKGIEDRFIRLPGETRINIKIMDEVNQQTTDVNAPGQIPGEYAIENFYKQIETLAETCEWFVLSGNIQPGLSPTFYADLISFLNTKNCKVALDTSGEALTEGLKASPCLVKPNASELSALIGKELSDTNAIHQAARSLLNEDLKIAVISMGKDGAVFCDQTASFVAVPPSVAVKSTVGAGDAMVAGLVAGLTRKMPLEDCARLATAFSVSAVTRLGRDLPRSEEIEAFRSQVKIVPLGISQPQG